MTEARIPITHSAMLESRRIINEHMSDPPSFIILLNEHDWTITPGRAHVAASKSLKHFSYADPAASILNDIDHRRIPVDFMDLFTRLKIPYYEGCLIVEVRDQRPKGRNNEPPLPEKIVLRPTAESINHDVKTSARKNGWGDKEALELESRLLLATSAPLILDPDPSINRMANIIARAAASPKKASLKRKVSEDSEEEHENAKRQKIMQVMKPVTKIPQTYAIANLVARRKEMEQQNKQQQHPANPANAVPSQAGGSHASSTHPRPAPMPIQQPPNGATNHAQAHMAVLQAAMRQRLAQAGGDPQTAGVAAQAALNTGIARQPLGQPHAPLAPGIVPPSTDAIKTAIEIGRSAKGFPLKLPPVRKQSQSAPGTSGIPSLPMGQPSTTGPPNHNPVPHPSATPISSHAPLGPQSRPVGVPTMPLQNGNQSAAKFHGQNPQAPQMQHMLTNPQYAAVLGHNPAASPMGGSVARPASAAQNHPPNGQMQPPQASRVPQQQGLAQHQQHTANPQLAAYLHGQPLHTHQAQGQPGGAQPAQPHQVPLNLLALLPVSYRTALFQQRTQFLQLGPVEKQAWLEKWADPQLKNHPDWSSKTDEEKASMVFTLRARQMIISHRQRLYAQNMQRMAGQVGIGQVGQGMMMNGMMGNGMMTNGMVARMPGANSMVGMVGMPGVMQNNMGGMPLQNGMPGQLPPQ